jgi:hypothetical protein
VSLIERGLQRRSNTDCASAKRWRSIRRHNPNDAFAAQRSWVLNDPAFLRSLETAIGPEPKA